MKLVLDFWDDIKFRLTPRVTKTSPPSHFSSQDDHDITNTVTIAVWTVPKKLIALKDNSAG